MLCAASDAPTLQPARTRCGCIAKGKARTRYELGSKVSVVTTAREGFVLDCHALAGNPYDGHTVDTTLKGVFVHTHQMPEHLMGDRGLSRE